jgi:hypothetical protein
MANKWFKASPGNSTRGLDIVRITVAIILAVHGFHGLFNPKAMAGLASLLALDLPGRLCLFKLYVVPH